MNSNQTDDQDADGVSAMVSAKLEIYMSYRHSRFRAVYY